MLPGTQFTAPPPTTPGEVGAGPRTPGEVTLGLALWLLIEPGLVTPRSVVAGLDTLGLVMVVGPLIDELPNEDPVIGCGVEPKVPVIGCGVEPKVPVIGSGVDVPPTLGLEIPGAEVPPMVGEVPNVPDPVIGAAVWANEEDAAATSAAATAEIMDFRLGI